MSFAIREGGLRMIAAAAIGAFAGLPAAAAIPPSAIQDQVPERVTIEVLAATVDESGTADEPAFTRVHLLARIGEVSRTASDLEPGDVILIRYVQDHRKRKRDQEALEARAKTGWVGPQVFYFPPVLHAGDTRLAFLGSCAGENAEGLVYCPGAHQYSFAPVPPPQDGGDGGPADPPGAED